MKIHIDQVGLFCSLGDSASEIYSGMCSGKTSFRPLHRFESAPYRQQTGGQISPEKEAVLRAKYPDEDLAAAFCKEAAYAALTGRYATPERTGIVFATNFGPQEYQEWLWREKLDTGSVSPESREIIDEFTLQLAEELNCLGPLAQISMSCASGGCAVEIGRDMLLRNRADQVLVIGYDLICEYSWCGLHNLHTITTESMRPFDLRRSGTIFSEGAAAMLLSKGDSPSVSPYFISGLATGNNAGHLTAPREEGEGSRQVMLRALQDAGLQPVDIEHICAHATSTQANDSTEAAALRNLFGESQLSRMTVGAHKSQLGHLLGAAALAEAIITLESMKCNIIPPNPTLEELDPVCHGIDCIPGEARYRKFSRAILNSAGIGGNNCAMILEKAAL